MPRRRFAPKSQHAEASPFSKGTFGSLNGRGKKIAITVSRFNEVITRRLLQSACDVLCQAGVSEKHIEIIWVPGALEIPFFVLKLLKTKRFDAVIALACVLRGDTYHYECVCHEVTRGISQAALETGIPVASGIITANTLEQAIDRSGLKAGNKGAHAALAALEIANLDRVIQKKKVKRHA